MTRLPRDIQLWLARERESFLKTDRLIYVENAQKEIE